MNVERAIDLRNSRACSVAQNVQALAHVMHGPEASYGTASSPFVRAVAGIKGDAIVYTFDRTDVIRTFTPRTDPWASFTKARQLDRPNLLRFLQMRIAKQHMITPGTCLQSSLPPALGPLAGGDASPIRFRPIQGIARPL
jgi:hypothetical protein